MKEDLPKRKQTRLKEYDYSSDGVYFVTICTENKRHLLSQIVGRGLALAVKLTDYGTIAENHLYTKKDLYYIYIQRYIQENNIQIKDINDERFCGSIRY